MKPDIDEFTGCAHVKNIINSHGNCRACSACRAGITKIVSSCMNHGTYMDEKQIAYCWNCGAIFDHSDDDEPIEDENG